MNITEALQLTDQKPTVLQIRNSDKNQVVAIGLKKHQVLKKHMTPQPALLVVLKGMISFDMEGTVTYINEMGTFEIPANVPHEVTGEEESIFLIIKEKG